MPIDDSLVSIREIRCINGNNKTSPDVMKRITAKAQIVLLPSRVGPSQVLQDSVIASEKVTE